MFNPTHICRKTVAATFVSAMIAGTASQAQTVQENFLVVSELAALIHEASASACMIDAGVATSAEFLALANARTSINNHLMSLAQGDYAAEAMAASEKWFPMDEAFSMILAGDTPAAYLDVLAKSKPALEFATLHLRDAVSHDLIGSNGVSIADVLTADVAGRQTVLVHQMKQMACALEGEDVSVETLAGLQDSVRLFEVSHRALVDGHDAMGIVPSENFAVQQILAATAFDWQVVRPMLDEIAYIGTATPSELSRLSGRIDGLEERISGLVDHYIVPAEQDDAKQVASLQ